MYHIEQFVYVEIFKSLWNSVQHIKFIILHRKENLTVDRRNDSATCMGLCLDVMVCNDLID